MFSNFKRILCLVIVGLLLTACKKEQSKEAKYMNISADEAKEIMDSTDDYVLLDVRTEEEFDEGHIPGAIVIPYDEIADRAEDELTEKDKTILVYCRSGRRSKVAAEILQQLGYTDIQEFGGIIDWQYEIEK